jgi:acetyltransferase-like isoleucine patch superfamily enzyme
LYRAAGVRIGARTHIYGKVQIEGVGRVAGKVRIGAGCMFTTPLFLNASAEVTIGDRVSIGHHVVIITDDHEFGDPTQRCGARVASPVVVEDGVWIAARVTVLPGVTLGRWLGDRRWRAGRPRRSPAHARRRRPGARDQGLSTER